MKKFLLFSCCLIFLKVSMGQQFQETYTPGTFTNGPFADGYYVAQTVDSGFIMTGQGSYTVISSNNNGDVFLLKTDKWGTIQWYKEYGGSAQEIGWWVEQTSDGGYIFSGQQRSSPAASQPRSYFGKTDASGTLQWSKTFTFTGAVDRASAVKQTADGGYIMAGLTALPSATDINACIIKLDANGTLQWMKTYEGAIVEWAKDILQLPDGGFIATGYTNSFGAGSEDIFIMRTDSSGNLIWFKTYGGIDTEIAYSICFAQGGGYVVTGQIGGNGSDICLMKTDTAGNLIWCNRYGNGLTDVAWSVKAAASGGYIVTGAAQNPANSSMGTFLLKTDTAGIREWYKFYDGGGYGNTIVQQTFDGGYVIGGKTNFGSIYLIKTDASGNTGCIETTFATTDTAVAPTVALANPVVTSVTPTLVVPPFTTSTPAITDSSFCLPTGEIEAGGNHAGFTIYPNPAINELIIENGKFKINEIEIYNSMGAKVFLPIVNYPLSIDVSRLPSGIYIVKVTGEKINWSEKFLKE